MANVRADVFGYLPYTSVRRRSHGAHNSCTASLRHLSHYLCAPDGPVVRAPLGRETMDKDLQDDLDEALASRLTENFATLDECEFPFENESMRARRKLISRINVLGLDESEIVTRTLRLYDSGIVFHDAHCAISLGRPV